MGKGIAEKLKDRYDIEIEHVGFEIHPDTDLKGVNLSEIFPGSEQMIEQLKLVGLKHGIEFGDVKQLFNTNKALLVGELAKDKHKGSDYANEMFKAYFGKGLDIGSDEVIVQIGVKLGLTEEDILEAMLNPKYIKRLKDNYLEGSKYEINSVPTFIFNDKYKLVGAQGEQAFIDILKKIV